jgi:uncharacterized membrane protein YbhN (UPF0104 family)
MTIRTKQLIKLAIRILITTGLLTWAFRQIEIEQFWQAIQTTKWQYLIGVWGLTAVFFWVGSVKMQLILKKQGFHVNIGTIFGASAVTCLYGMVIPGILSTGIKWYILKKDTGKGSVVFSSMVYNQFSLFVVMMVVGLTSLMIANSASLLPYNEWIMSIICGLSIVVVVFVSLLLVNSRTGSKFTKGLEILLRPFPEQVRQKGQEVLAQIAIFQSAGTGFHLIMVLITLIAALGISGVTYIFAARAANIVAPIPILILLCAVIYVLARLPISVANLGVREATLVGLLGIYGIEKSAALLMSMILFSGLIFMAIIGAIYQLFWKVSSKKSPPRPAG